MKERAYFGMSSLFHLWNVTYKTTNDICDMIRFNYQKKGGNNYERYH